MWKLATTLCIAAALATCGREGADRVTVTGSDCPNPAQLVKGVTLTCQGTEIVGTAQLNGPAACAAAGQSDCVATGQFKAVDIASVHASDIRQGVSIAGVTGSLQSFTANIPACIADGDKNCEVVGSLVAADTTGAATKIVAGQTLAGIAGEGVVTTAADCSSNQQIGCLTTSAFQSMEADRIAECLK